MKKEVKFLLDNLTKNLVLMVIRNELLTGKVV